MLGDNAFNGDIKPGTAEFKGTSLGLTVEDIVIENEKDFTDIYAAQHGTKPIDKILTGEIWMVTMKLTKYSIAQLAVVLSGMTVSAGGNAAKKESICYQSIYDLAGLLVIKRTECGNTASTDEDYWINFPRAYPVNDSDILTFGPSDQENFEVKFFVFKDRTAGSDSLGYFWWSGAGSTALA